MGAEGHGCGSCRLWVKINSGIGKGASRPRRYTAMKDEDVCVTPSSSWICLHV